MMVAAEAAGAVEALEAEGVRAEAGEAGALSAEGVMGRRTQRRRLVA